MHIILISLILVPLLGLYLWLKSRNSAYLSQKIAAFALCTVAGLLLCELVFGTIMHHAVCTSFNYHLFIVSWAIVLFVISVAAFILEPYFSDSKSHNTAGDQIDWRTSQVNKGFLSSLSHEIRSPVNLITHVIDGLDNKWDQLDNEERKELVHLMKYGVQCLSELVLNASDLNDLVSDQVKLKYSSIAIADIIDGAIQASEKLMQHKKDIRITYENDTRDIQSQKIECDKYYIKKVIQHLILNAIAHGYHNQSGEIQILISPTKFDAMHGTQHLHTIDGILCQVTDSGIGIPQKEFFKIFQPWQQSSKTAKDIGGKGLGLPICFEVIKLHGGKIWVENNRHSIGSTFAFTIPVRKHGKN